MSKQLGCIVALVFMFTAKTCSKAWGAVTGERFEMSRAFTDDKSESHALMSFILLGVLFVVYMACGLIEVHAARLDSGDNGKIYLDAKTGKLLTAIEADRETTLDGEVLQCAKVEKVCNQKTGNCRIAKKK